SSVHTSVVPRHLHAFPTRRSSDLCQTWCTETTIADHGRRRSEKATLLGSRHVDAGAECCCRKSVPRNISSCSCPDGNDGPAINRSEEHTSELQSRGHLVCRLLLEK